MYKQLLYHRSGFNAIVKLRFRDLNANCVFYNCGIVCVYYACVYCLTHYCVLIFASSKKSYSQLKSGPIVVK